MTRWTPARRVVLESEGEPAPNGVGAVRALHVLGPPVRERVTAFEPPSRMAYAMLSGAPLDDYVGEITLTPTEAGTLITWSIEFRPRFPGVQTATCAVIGRACRSLAKQCRALREHPAG
jgi:hypothetical protein